MNRSLSASLLALAAAPVLFLALFLAPTSSMAIEEPDYKVLKTFDTVELRQYAPYVVAEVVLTSAADDPGNEAFPILAGYIFGKNKGERKLDMTAPVTQAAVASPREGQKLDMTAPVTQAATAGGATAVGFVLPKGVTLANAPEPLDPRVVLRDVPASTWAVIRYSGTWSKANYDEHLTQLRATLRTQDIATQGEPVLARYNPPLMPWFLRRNEIWLAVP